MPLALIGKGGMGAVYVAEDSRLHRRVALKTLRRELAADSAARARYLREARAMAAVEHEHVATIHLVGDEGEIPYIVMPLLIGESLEQALNRTAIPPSAESCRIGREIAAGLAAAHAKGLIHRDIKPSNVWLEGSSGKVKLLDFGLAQAAESDLRLTSSGAMLGTPAYMAPEQASGQPVTARADLFSLGCILYEMTTGRRPFAGETLLATLKNLAVLEPSQPRQLNPAVPPRLSEFITRLLAKDPQDRPPSAVAVEEELAACISDIAALPQAAGKLPQATYRLRRLRGVAAFVAAIVVLAAAIGVWSRVASDRGEMIVEIQGGGVAARLAAGGLVVEDQTGKRKWTVSGNAPQALPSGDYLALAAADLTLSVADEAGAESTTKEFRIRPGGRVILRVRAVASDIGSENKSVTRESLPIKTEEERAAAEWVQRCLGVLELQLLSGKWEVVPAEQALPAESFLVRAFEVDGSFATATNQAAFAHLRSVQRVCIRNARPGIPFEALQKANALKELQLFAVQGDETLRGVESLPSLTSVHLEGIINELHLNKLVEMPQLQHLRLEQSTYLSSEVVDQVVRCLALKKLSFACPLQEDDISKLAQLTNLEHLSLSVQPGSGDYLTGLKSLVNLKGLDITLHEALTINLNEIVQHLPNLESLKINGQALRLSDLAGLEQHSRLTKLFLQDAPVEADWLKRLQSFHRLRELHLPPQRESLDAERALLRVNPRLEIYHRFGGLLSSWNSGAVIDGPVPYPAAIPGIRRWQLVPTYSTNAQHCSAANAGGKHWVVASPNSTVLRIFDEDFQFVRHLITPAESGGVSDVRFSGDGGHVVALNYGLDRLSVIPTDGSPANIVSDLAARRVSTHPQEDWMVIGDNSGSLHLRGVTGTKGPSWEASSSAIIGLAWAPNGETIASVADGERLLRIWNRDGTLRVSGKLPGPIEAGVLQNVAWSNDGTLLALAGGSEKTYLVDSKGDLQHIVAAGGPLTWHPVTNHLFGYREGRLQEFDLGGRQLELNVTIHNTATTANWTADGRQLVFSTGQGTIIDTRTEHGWTRDWETLVQIGEGAATPFGMKPISFTHDGRSLIQPWGRILFSWTADGSSSRVALRLPPGQFISQVSRNPVRPEFLLSTSANDIALLIDESGRRLKTWHGLRSCAGTPAYSPDGKWVVIATNTGKLRIDAADGSPGVELEEAQVADCVIAWSHDSRRLAISAQGDGAGIWNLDGSRGPKIQPPWSQGLSAIAWSPDGERLALSGVSFCFALVRSSDGGSIPLLERSLGYEQITLDWDRPEIITGISRTKDHLALDGVRHWSAEGRSLSRTGLLAGYAEGTDRSPTGDVRTMCFSNGRFAVFGETGDIISIGLPIQRDGEWISVSADGKVLAKSDNCEPHLRYLVEYDDGRTASRTFEEFHSETSQALLRQ